MAKKTNILILRLACGVCNRQNYFTRKNKINTSDKLALSRYCPFCRQHTLHEERKK